MKIYIKYSINIFVFVVLCLLVGYVGSMFQEEALLTWYPTLNLSPLTPPAIVFPIAWTILYIFMGISIALILNSPRKSRTICYKVFAWQLVANFLWSIIFFYFENPFWGMIDIIVLDVLVIFYTFVSYKYNRLSSILFIPYVLWLLFATYLNGYIWVYN